MKNISLFNIGLLLLLPGCEKEEKKKAMQTTKAEMVIKGSYVALSVSVWINSEGMTDVQQIFEADTKPSMASEFYMEGTIPGTIRFHVADDSDNLPYCYVSGREADQWIHLAGT